MQNININIYIYIYIYVYIITQFGGHSVGYQLPACPYPARDRQVEGGYGTRASDIPPNAKQTVLWYIYHILGLTIN